ncbi:uncharacterized protein LOC141901838 isoform X1 [Tubulanus polymorphus]|uniref:uncharacterized protein LOC141901838 isoform X1 n=1 Tax=Tubulanus polymorphus TaxID=672921 RepID=UPI003DA4E221
MAKWWRKKLPFGLYYMGPVFVVTPKSHGLNPNANIFQSKSPPGQWMEAEAPLVSPTHSEGYNHMNGDISTSAAETMPPTAKTDYQSINGANVNDLKIETLPASTSIQNTVLMTTSFTHVNVHSPSFIDDGGNHSNSSNYEGSNNVPEDQLKQMLKEQLEYYFSRDNLASDSYLVSQMDADQYVPIVTIASFNMVKKLTSDLDLIINVLRESSNVQVDERGEKVRPLHKRCIVILREIPESTPIESVKALFSGVNCPPFVSCEFAHNNSWYVTFDSDEDAQRAYRYLREDIQNFLGKPIMARIKAKPLLTRSFAPKNGVTPRMQPINAVAAQQPPTPTQYEMTSQAQPTPPQPPQPQPAQFSQQPRFTQPVPNVQYVSQHQQSFSFFPPATSAVIAASWPTSPPAYYDPGMVFAVNGYQPQGTFKPLTTSRHGYQNIRNRNPSKPQHRNHMSERSNHIERHHSSSSTSSTHERHNLPNGTHRSSPRAHDSTQNHNNTTSNAYGRHKESSYNNNYSQSPNHTPSDSQSTTQSNSSSSSYNRNNDRDSRHNDSYSKDQMLQKRNTSYKVPRRRKEDEVPSRNVRQSSGNSSSNNSMNNQNTKEVKQMPAVDTPKFELESNSFPPLPGSTNSATTGDIWESKMSDVVKGTAKPSTPATPTTRETKTPSSSTQTTAPSTTTPPSSNDLNITTTCSVNTATQSTLTSSTSTVNTTVPAVTTTIQTSPSVTTPPSSPKKVTPASKVSSSSGSSNISNSPKDSVSHSSNSKSESVRSLTPPPAVSSTTTSSGTDGSSNSLKLEEKVKAANAAQSGPSKMSYASVLRGAGNGFENKKDGPSLEAIEDNSDNEKSKTVKESSGEVTQALMEQSQVPKSQTAKPVSNNKDNNRRDEPKDQRQSASRRAKENRERRDRVDREQRVRKEPPRSPNK